MSFKVFMPGALSATEWSQAGWRLGEPVDEAEHKLITPVLRRHLPVDGLVLDAGCGTGKWVAHLARLGYRVIGLDLSADALAAARRDAPRAGLARADTQCAPIRDGAVDAVLSLGVVEHDERGPLAGLRELHRILKPGGMLVLDVPFNNWFRRLVTNPVSSADDRAAGGAPAGRSASPSTASTSASCADSWRRPGSRSSPPIPTTCGPRTTSACGSISTTSASTPSTRRAPTGCSASKASPVARWPWRCVGVRGSSAARSPSSHGGGCDAT